MPELLLVVAFIVGLFVIEIWYVRRGKPTISEHVQDLNRQMSKQLIAGIYFALGTVAGWMIAHFTTF